MEIREQIGSKEIKSPNLPRIRLELFRHDDREEVAVAGKQNVKDNQRITLSRQGRIHAQEAGGKKSPQLETALAYGSPRDRSLETSLRQMLSGQPEMDEKSFEEIKDSVAKGKFKKYIIAPELDYDVDSNEHYRETIDDHIFKKGNYISFLYHDSDRIAQELGDEKSTTYSRQAANVAKLIDKYVAIFPRWQQLAQEESGKYVQFQNELQRFMGTHGGILESFLLKVIDKQEGKDSAEEFIRNLPDGNGFDFSEGFTINIDEQEGKPNIRLNYKDKSWNIKQELLDNIIKMK